MKEIFRTNNAVYLSFAQAVLKDAGIETLLFDAHMSVMDGSIGALPRRLMVIHDEQLERARQILAEAEPLDIDEFEPE
jgi:putative signal transducing protein